MPDAIDLKKLEKFVEAAISDWHHPVYQAGWQQSPALQHYAVNVATMGAIQPEQWFKDYPEWTRALNEAMVYCETEAANDAQATAGRATVRQDVTALQGQITALEAAIAVLSTGAAKPDAVVVTEAPVTVPAPPAPAAPAAADATCPHCGGSLSAAS